MALDWLPVVSNPARAWVPPLPVSSVVRSPNFRLERYWVGGTATWDTTAGAKWSAVDGGVSGASAPTSSVNAYFTDLSGVGTVTISGAVCADLISRGSNTVTLTGVSTLTISGNADFSIFGNSITGTITFNATSADKRIKMPSTNGVGNAANITFNGVGGSWDLLSDIGAAGIGGTIAGTITFTNGTVNANGFNVYASKYALGAGTKTVNMGSGNWFAQSTGAVWNFNTNVANLTLNAGTSLITLGDNTAGAATFSGGGKTYYNIIAASNFNLTISQGNTFNEIRASRTDTTFAQISFPATLTTTLTVPPQWYGVTIISSTAGVTATLSCANGYADCNNLSLKDNTATGGAVFYEGALSTEVSNVVGWQTAKNAPKPALMMSAANEIPIRRPFIPESSVISVPDAAVDPMWASRLISFSPQFNPFIPQSENSVVMPPQFGPTPTPTPTWAAVVFYSPQHNPSVFPQENQIVMAPDTRDADPSWAAGLLSVSPVEFQPYRPESLTVLPPDAVTEPFWAATFFDARPTFPISQQRQPFVFANIPLGEIKYWNGSVWLAKRVKYWDGAKWVEKPLKYWTGTVWRITGF